MLVPKNEFESTVDALRELLDSGAARILIVPSQAGADFEVRFEMRQEHAAVEKMLAERALRFGRFQDAAEDVGEALAAAAHSRSAKVFARVRSRDDAPGSRREDADLAAWKFQLVEQRFDVAALRRRVWLKRTTKTPLLLSMRWDVGHRAADDDIAVPGGGTVPYAMLRVEGVNAVNSPLSAFSQPVEHLTLTMDQDDIGAMIDTLRRLHGVLAAESTEAAES